MGSLRNLWRRDKRANDIPNPPAHDTHDDPPVSHDVGYNPHRDDYLYWLTEDGYIIAQDVTCQYDYVQDTPCARCGGELKTAAHLNRAGQGLSELVAVCKDCGKPTNFIFDISNHVYQAWLADQLGALYVRQHDNAPREPFEPN